MMQYEIPKDRTIVKRLSFSDDIKNDHFAIIFYIAEVDYQTARSYWLGRVSLAELLQVEAV